MRYSKARTLSFLSSKLKSAKILPLFIFSLKEYKSKKDLILQEILSQFKVPLIVRSSALNEDTKEASQAGMYESVLDVKPNKKDLHEAILKVISSYKTPKNEDEIFISPMLKNVQICGVIFSADKENLAPYFTINYDISGKTDGITSGNEKHTFTFVCFKDHEPEDENLAKLIKATKEIQELLEEEFLDIEFAIKNDEIYIFQVRSIVKKNKEDLSEIDLKDALFKIEKKFNHLNSPHPKLLGDKSIFGVMPDWNPAEIIGRAPKTLALSLYKELITDEIWAYQRDNYGYRNLRSHPLLISFMGLAYIDTRISFNSFIPKDLDENTAKKLVNFYLKSLKDNKSYHDKVEFKIVFSCYDFSLEDRLKLLISHGFSLQEIENIKQSLKNITNKILDKEGIFKQDLLKIEKLEHLHEKITNSDLSLIEKIYWLSEDCKRYGTLPFAGLARAAFIAVQFLHSLEQKGILSKYEIQHYLSNLHTISKDLNQDLLRLKREEFLQIYGHLRPGTYDINSPRYDENFEIYFSKSSKKAKKQSQFVLEKEAKRKIDLLLKSSQINCTCEELFYFIKTAIEARERAKFLFTKLTSEILRLIGGLGSRFDINKDELCYLDFAVLKRLYSTLEEKNLKEILLNNIKQNKQSYQFTKALKLPALITSSKDIYAFFLKKDEANFIGSKKIIAHVATLEDKDLKNKIVCISSADPGYDFLFSKGIKALVTCYGGVNSHMAIRASELGLCAIIGAGELLYEKISNANVVEIDSENKKYKIIS